MSIPQPDRSDARIPLGRIAVFVGIALALSSALSTPFALGLLPGEAVGLVVPLAQLSPLLAALAVRRRGERVREVLALVAPSRRDLGAGLVAAVAVLCLVPLARLAVGVLTGAAPWDPVDDLLGVALAVPVVAAMQTVLAIGEETGWRGWLHTQLRPLGLWPASLAIGALWALWHLPVVLALGFGARESIAYLMVIWAVGPVLSALREVGGCVWPAVLGHGLLNSVRVAVDQSLTVPLAERGSVGFWAIEAVGWALWILAAWVVMRVGSWRRRHADRTGADGPIPGPGSPVGPLH